MVVIGVATLRRPVLARRSSEAPTRPGLRPPLPRVRGGSRRVRRVLRSPEPGGQRPRWQSRHHDRPGRAGPGGAGAVAALPLDRTSTRDFGRLAIAPLDDLSHPQYTPLSCDRVAYDGDRGLCLITNQGAITTYEAVIFDQRFDRLFTIGLVGLPSRARVSHDGRYGATTTFVYGDSYAGTSYSTRTQLYDLRSGQGARRPRAVHHAAQRQGDRQRRSQPLGRDVRPVRQQPLLRHREHRRQLLPGAGRHRPPADGGAPRRRGVPVASRPTAPASPSRSATSDRWAGSSGSCRSSTCRRWSTTRWPRPAASTTRPSGSTTAPCSTPLPRSTSGTPADDTWAVPADGSGSPSALPVRRLLDDRGASRPHLTRRGQPAPLPQGRRPAASGRVARRVGGQDLDRREVPAVGGGGGVVERDRRIRRVRSGPCTAGSSRCRRSRCRATGSTGAGWRLASGPWRSPSRCRPRRSATGAGWWSTPRGVRRSPRWPWPRPRCHRSPAWPPR